MKTVFFCCLFLLSIKSFGLSCGDVLADRGIVFEFEDAHRIYAVGKTVDGKKKVHIVEIEGVDFSKKALLLRAKEVVLRRENWSLFHNKLYTVDNLFQFKTPMNPALTRMETEGRGGSRVLTMMRRLYNRKGLGGDGFNKTPDFNYGDKTHPKTLLSIELKTVSGTFELIFNIRAEPKNLDQFAHMYGLYVATKMGLGAVDLGTLKFYGEVD